MIVLPQQIFDIQNISGKNRVTRLCGFNEIKINPESDIIESVSPFVVIKSDIHILLTSNIMDDFDGYDYVVLTRKKPRRIDFINSSINCVRWLKHPQLLRMSPSTVVSSWKGQFYYKKEDQERHQVGLRIPQICAIHAYMAKAPMQKERNIIVMPTGTGKTETMLGIMIASMCEKLLITVPSDSLRSQTADKFISLGILKRPEFGIVGDNALYPNVGVVSSGVDIVVWRELIEKSNVIISTMSLLAGVQDEIKSLMSESFSHIFVDEAHHSEATTWQEFIDIFEKKKVSLFTATPFRNDGKKLQGEFIYNFSLKNAQDQGYYKPIQLIPIREYDKEKADQAIASAAVAQLKRDEKIGYSHILMARCATKDRANQVLSYYQQYPEFNPIVVYSSMPYSNKIFSEIKNKEHRIIVCVNMLGEGFDLPEMKIAAIHDRRQSIPITLQFIGRFTRTSKDNQLGNASFVTNLANPPIESELRELYSRDADWNTLLPYISDNTIREEVDFSNLIKSFRNVDNSKVAFQSIRPAMSAVIYRTQTNSWCPSNWNKVFIEENYAYSFGSESEDGNTLIVILGSIKDVDWGKIDSIQSVEWNYVIIHRRITPHYNHVYINSSTSVDEKKIMEQIFGEEGQRVAGEVMFRAFSNIRRLSVINFGGRKSIAGNLSFKSFYGKDVQNGISEMEKGTLIKNNIFGYGFEDGVKASIGCSVKGKIWSYLRGNILQLVNWYAKIGTLIEDDTISPDVVLQNTLKLHRITELPMDYVPIAVDWDSEIYQEAEGRFRVIVNDIEYPFFDTSLEITQFVKGQKTVDFKLTVDGGEASYSIEYGEDEKGAPYYKVSRKAGVVQGFVCGGKVYQDICDYFNANENVPVVYFSDGAVLFGNNYAKPKAQNSPIDSSHLIPISWEDIDISKESQGIVPYITNSIQYHFSQYIKNQYEFLYDDDGSGEMADLIGINNNLNEVEIDLYHLKFAKGGNVNNDITNFYEVCGQAVRSEKLHYPNNASGIVQHLLKRKDKKRGAMECSRILKGDEEYLENLENIVLWKKPVQLHIYIVQPSLSKENASDNILNLLGAVSAYLDDVANIELKVFCSK